MSSTRRPQRTGELDNYQTPEPAIRVLEKFIAPYIRTTDTWMEPCRGNGNIIRVLRPHFTGDADWCEITDGRDYLLETGTADWIPTNPPYSLAMEFLVKSLEEAENVAYLLRLNFLGSKVRRPFWQAHPPQALLPLSERPSFVEKRAQKLIKGKLRWVTTKTDSIEYGWFIWSPRVPKGIYVL